MPGINSTDGNVAVSEQTAKLSEQFDVGNIDSRKYELTHVVLVRKSEGVLGLKTSNIAPSFARERD
jgi:hypothetical protein